MWLAWVVCGVRSLSLLLNLGPAANLNFREITSLRHVLFLGDSVAIGEGPPNPWTIVGPLSLLLLVIFVADASLTAWRRGDRRQALVVAGSLGFFAIGSTLAAVLVLGQIVHAPLTASPVYLGLMVVMGYQLSDDVFRAVRLSDDLREREQQMALAADAAGLGLWIWTTPQDTVWANEIQALMFLTGLAMAHGRCRVAVSRQRPQGGKPPPRALSHDGEDGPPGDGSGIALPKR